MAPRGPKPLAEVLVALAPPFPACGEREVPACSQGLQAGRRVHNMPRVRVTLRPKRSRPAAPATPELARRRPASTRKSRPMLDAMRRGALNWLSKILLALLVVAFAVWGVADV